MSPTTPCRAFPRTFLEFSSLEPDDAVGLGVGAGVQAHGAPVYLRHRRPARFRRLRKKAARRVTCGGIRLF